MGESCTLCNTAQTAKGKSSTPMPPTAPHIQPRVREQNIVVGGTHLWLVQRSLPATRPAGVAPPPPKTWAAVPRLQPRDLRQGYRIVGRTRMLLARTVGNSDGTPPTTEPDRHGTHGAPELWQAARRAGRAGKASCSSSQPARARRPAWRPPRKGAEQCLLYPAIDPPT